MTEMIIKDEEIFSRTKLRSHLLDIAEEGLKMVNPQMVLKKMISFKDGKLSVCNNLFDLKEYENIYLVGIGKASCRASYFLEKKIGEYLTKGVVIDVVSKKSSKIEYLKGDHPYPTETNILATEKIIQMLQGVTSKDLVIAIISGGGSSLLCNPYKMTCDSLKNVTESLFRVGANITEINIIRKHLSLIHGGNLAKLAYPGRVLGLILSDISENEALVASGPTFYDETTKEDAERILNKYKIVVNNLCETPKDRKYFKKVTNICVVSNIDPILKMKDVAEALGYDVIFNASYLKGEAKAMGKKIALRLNKMKPKTALIYGGETVVRVKGGGVGGRNTELALASIPFLQKGELLASIASDGKDNILGVAGGLADDLVKKTISDNNLDIKTSLINNDSYTLLSRVNGLIRIKKTGGNVADFVIALKD